MKNSKAFTLIEILIILLITGMVISIAIPSLSKRNARELKSSASKFASFLSYIQELSLIESKVYRLNININDGSFVLYAKEDGNFSELEKKKEFSKKLFIKEALCLGKKTYNGECYVYFFPNGSNTGLELTLSLNKNKDLAYGVELDRVTGRTYVKLISKK